MNRLSFGYWLKNEMANYGFGDTTNQIMGGTDPMTGDSLFQPIDTSLIMNELVKMPNLGTIEANQVWDDCIQWGTEPGAFSASISPLGSMRVVTRRLTKDLEGTPTWICKEVYGISDFDDQHKEKHIAHRVFNKIVEMNKENMDAPIKEYNDLEKLAWKLWHATKRQHPSYIMFPTTLRKQDENYYKLVYEFRGQGAGAPNNGKTGRAEQFDIDLVYYPKRGLIRCFGYDIDSRMRQRDWYVSTMEWNEFFSPHQDETKIIESIIKLFLQY